MWWLIRCIAFWMQFIGLVGLLGIATALLNAKIDEI